MTSHFDCDAIATVEMLTASGSELSRSKIARTLWEHTVGMDMPAGAGVLQVVEMLICGILSREHCFNYRPIVSTSRHPPILVGWITFE